MISSPFTPCALIPVYNHWQVLAETVAALRRLELPVVLVDDGSDDRCRAELARLADAGDGDVHLVTRAGNGGKGAAVKTGLAAAKALGFSHAVQIDADGQHNIHDVAGFIGAARCRPEALIAGYPIFDDSVPRHRYIARYATHVWVWLNTLSTTIRDSMCGFRVYPLEATLGLVSTVHTGDRMDFDTEILVRWYWAGYPLVQRGTRVTYPADGVSHFRLGRDNGLIALMHARLFFGMLRRLPSLLAQKRPLSRKGRAG